MNASNWHESILFWLLLAGRVYRNKLQARLRKLGLYAGQDQLLMRLWQSDGQTQSQLAQQLQIRPSTLTRMIKRVEVAGFIRSKTDARDGRISRVFLTPKGLELQDQVEATWQLLEDQAFSSLTTEERLLLRRLLMQLQSERGSR